MTISKEKKLSRNKNHSYSTLGSSRIQSQKLQSHLLNSRFHLISLVMILYQKIAFVFRRWIQTLVNTRLAAWKVFIKASKTMDWQGLSHRCHQILDLMWGIATPKSMKLLNDYQQSKKSRINTSMRKLKSIELTRTVSKKLKTLLMCQFFQPRWINSHHLSFLHTSIVMRWLVIRILEALRIGWGKNSRRLILSQVQHTIKKDKCIMEKS